MPACYEARFLGSDQVPHSSSAGPTQYGAPYTTNLQDALQATALTLAAFKFQAELLPDTSAAITATPLPDPTAGRQLMVVGTPPRPGAARMGGSAGAAGAAPSSPPSPLVAKARAAAAALSAQLQGAGLMAGVGDDTLAVRDNRVFTSPSKSMKVSGAEAWGAGPAAGAGGAAGGGYSGAAWGAGGSSQGWAAAGAARAYGASEHLGAGAGARGTYGSASTAGAGQWQAAYTPAYSSNTMAAAGTRFGGSFTAATPAQPGASGSAAPTGSAASTGSAGYLDRDLSPAPEPRSMAVPTPFRVSMQGGAPPASSSTSSAMPSADAAAGAGSGAAGAVASGTRSGPGMGDEAARDSLSSWLSRPTPAATTSQGTVFTNPACQPAAGTLPHHSTLRSSLGCAAGYAYTQAAHAMAHPGEAGQVTGAQQHMAGSSIAHPYNSHNQPTSSGTVHNSADGGNLGHAAPAGPAPTLTAGRFAASAAKPPSLPSLSVGLLRPLYNPLAGTAGQQQLVGQLGHRGSAPAQPGAHGGGGMGPSDGPHPAPAADSAAAYAAGNAGFKSGTGAAGSGATVTAGAGIAAGAGAPMGSVPAWVATSQRGMAGAHLPMYAAGRTAGSASVPQAAAQADASGTANEGAIVVSGSAGGQHEVLALRAQVGRVPHGRVG